MSSKVLLLVVALAGCDKGPARSEAATSGANQGGSGQPVAVASANDKKFGAGVTMTAVTSVDQLLANPTAFKGKTVRVEGLVTDVCPKRGCWFELAGEQPGQKLKFKVTDGEMVFPLESKGMHAIAQGTVSVKDLTLEETKQYAEYQAKEYGKPYDPTSITKPMQVVRLDGTGAIFRDKR